MSHSARVAVLYGPGSVGPIDIATAATEADIELAFLVADERQRGLLARFGEAHLVGPVDSDGVLPMEADLAIDGIVTFSEMLVPAVARIAAARGLPGHPLASLDRITTKRAQRAALAMAGLSRIAATPIVVKPSGEVLYDRDRDNDLSFPAVLKPDAGSGSRSTYLVRSWTEALDLAVRDSVSRVESRWVLEELLSGAPHPVCDWLGDYVSVESLVALDGSVSHVCVSDRLPLAPPFRETGVVIPSFIGGAPRERLLAATEAALCAVGVGPGVTHTELKLTPGGPAVIEVNGRVGGSTPELCERALGVSLTRAALELAMGRSVAVDPVARGIISTNYLVPAPQRPVVARRLPPPSAVRELPGVWRVTHRIRPGTPIDWREGTESYVSSVWFDAPDPATLAKRLETISAAYADVFDEVDLPENG